MWIHGTGRSIICILPHPRSYFNLNFFFLSIQWLKPSEGGLLEPEDPLEKTYSIRQQSILPEVDVLSSSKAFDMKLPGPSELGNLSRIFYFVLCSSLFLIILVCADLGPYTIRYLSNGRYMLLGGQKGHVAMMDVLNLESVKEFQVCYWSYCL